MTLSCPWCYRHLLLVCKEDWLCLLKLAGLCCLVLSWAVGSVWVSDLLMGPVQPLAVASSSSSSSSSRIVIIVTLHIHFSLLHPLPPTPKHIHTRTNTLPISFPILSFPFLPHTQKNIVHRDLKLGNMVLNTR